MLGPTPHAARCPPASGFAPLRASTVCGPCQRSGPATGPERVPRAAGTKLHTPGSLTQTFPLNPGGWSRGSGEGRAVPPKASVLGSRCRRHGRSQDGVTVTACCTGSSRPHPGLETAGHSCVSARTPYPSRRLHTGRGSAAAPTRAPTQPTVWVPPGGRPALGERAGQRDSASATGLGASLWHRGLAGGRWRGCAPCRRGCA